MTAAPLSAELHEGWTVTCTGGPAPVEIVDVPAEVPGVVHTDLLAAGLIPDPYLDLNEKALQWIGECDFRYRTSFDHATTSHAHVELVFDSLDTAATITLNGTVLGTVENQHRSWRFEVRELLREQGNELVIDFASAVNTAKANEQLLGSLPTAYDLPYNAIRKMACNFGWDWGPVLVTCGIVGGVRLEGWDSARIEAVRPLTWYEDSKGGLDLSIDVVGEADEVRLTLSSPSGEVVLDESLAVADGGASSNHSLDVEAWWPRGYGDQPLYECRVQTLREGVVTDERTRRIGFRSAGFVQETDEIGTSFVMTVNDVPVLVKGANWIPDDCFPTRLGVEGYRAAIDFAIESNMNLLRVWGGGLYESDVFYDYCDEQGILVWQDFTFACAAYSELEPMRSQVEAEARENISRLSSHPSLVHWNGCNENIEAYHNWGWKPLIAEGQGWGLYYYTELFPALLAELDPTRSYAPSSPYSIPLPEDTRNPNHGTVHEWQVWNQVDYTHYADYVPRFSAEFGFQGPANRATIARAIHDDPLLPNSPGMMLHEKADQGFEKLENGYAPHLPRPVDFDDWHFTTQLNQARALRFGIEHYRSWWPTCGGTIIWQLNDCWPVSSWAAVDGDNRKKLLWYQMRSLYRDVVATFQPRDEELALVVGNDTDDELTLTVRFARRSLAGQDLATDQAELVVPARSGAQLTVPDELLAVGDERGEYLVADLAGAPEPVRASHYFVEDIALALAAPAEAYSTQVKPVEGGVAIEVTANSLVKELCVLADLVDPDAVVDQALVTLQAGETAVFTVTTSKGVEAGWDRHPVLQSVNSLIARSAGLRGR